jgi:histidine phosphotransfer protein HptB
VATQDSLIDPTVFGDLLASVGGDQGFLAELIDTYLIDSTDQLATLRSSLAADDAEGFRRAAHSLKSNSANFGANGLAAQAKELEMMARAGSLDGAEAKLASFEDTYARVSAELSHLRAGG